MNSDRVKKGMERAPHRSLMHATGLTDDDIKKPFIAVCNSFNEVIPGHVHLNQVGRLICEAVREAGGTPVESRVGHVFIRVEKQSVATPTAIDSADLAQHRRLTKPKKSGDESHALQNAPRTALPVSLLREPQ